MNPVREAIFDLLNDSQELADLATGGIHWQEADPGAEPPLVIIAKNAGSDIWTFDGPPLQSDVWTVRGVGFADDAEDIDELCRELLNDAALQINGRVHMYLKSETAISYGEVSDGERYSHEGAAYRLYSEASS